MLPPCPRVGLLRRRRRSFNDFPARSAGTALVFKSSGTFVEPRLDDLSDLGSPTVVNAVNVFSVSTKREIVGCRVVLPAADASDFFIVTARFECFLADPSAALDNGYYELAPSLEAYVKKCPRLRLVTRKMRVSDLAKVEASVAVRIAAYGEFKPPHFTGFEVRIPEVTVCIGSANSEAIDVVRNEEVSA